MWQGDQINPWRPGAWYTSISVGTKMVRFMAFNTTFNNIGIKTSYSYVIKKKYVLGFGKAFYTFRLILIFGV